MTKIVIPESASRHINGADGEYNEAHAREAEGLYTFRLTRVDGTPVEYVYTYQIDNSGMHRQKHSTMPPWWIRLDTRYFLERCAVGRNTSSAEPNALSCYVYLRSGHVLFAIRPLADKDGRKSGQPYANHYDLVTVHPAPNLHDVANLAFMLKNEFGAYPQEENIHFLGQAYDPLDGFMHIIYQLKMAYEDLVAQELATDPEKVLRHFMGIGISHPHVAMDRATLESAGGYLGFCKRAVEKVPPFQPPKTVQAA